MRFPLRSLATLVVAVGLTMCADGPNVPLKQTAGRGQFSLRPVWSPAAAAVYASRAAFAAVDFDHVRIVLVRPPDQVVKDTTITFNPDSPPTAVEILVDVRSTGEVFNGRMDYMNDGVVVFSGAIRVASHPVDGPPPTPQDVEIVYVGPGANTARLVVQPKTSNITAPGGVTLTASAFDSSGAAVANVPVSWSTSDATIATVNANTGAVVAGTRRGTATITAVTPTGISDNGTVTVALPPAAIAVASGSGQTGKVGTTLPQPGVVRVTASDGLGVAGVTVNFAAPTGGSVGAASATTNAEGLASTTMTLAGTVGPQSFAATAAGFSTSIQVTATAGDPASIAAVSGSGQRDTVRRALPAPFVARVTDQFGNGVSGVTVNWARTAGNGSLGGSTSATDADGRASMTYTFGSTAGNETVTASVSGVSTVATFSATALSAGAAAIAIVSGNTQTGRANQALAAPLVVRVTDAQGNPVPSSPVNWTATNGTIARGTSTDAEGLSTNTFTLGSTVGSASATATIGSGTAARSVTFTATVQPGAVARLVITTQPSNGSAGVAIAPAVRVELQDAAGNRTAASNAVTVSLGENPGEAMLLGTRTRAASGGVVVFDDLMVSGPGGGYTLVFSSAGVPNVTSAPFGMTGARMGLFIHLVDPNDLEEFEETPHVTMTAGQAPVNPPAIRITNANNAGIPGATIEYTVYRGETAIFGGNATSNAQGVITFAALMISPSNLQVAGDYEFFAGLPGDEGGVSLPVTVVAAAPVRYLVNLSPPTPPLQPAEERSVTATLSDQFGNAVSTPNPRTVTWTLTGAGELSALTTSTDSAGQTFNVYLAPSTVGATATISVTDGQYSGQQTFTIQQGTSDRSPTGRSSGARTPPSTGSASRPPFREERPD